MDKNRIQNFEKNMGAFPLKFLRAVKTLLITMEQKGVTLDDVYDYIEYKHLLKLDEEKRVKEYVKAHHTHRDCSECSGTMFAYPVNDKPDAQTGDPTENSVWLCQNRGCMHTIYNKETVDQLIERGTSNG